MELRGLSIQLFGIMVMTCHFGSRLRLEQLPIHRVTLDIALLGPGFNFIPQSFHIRFLTKMKILRINLHSINKFHGESIMILQTLYYVK